MLASLYWQCCLRSGERTHQEKQELTKKSSLGFLIVYISRAFLWVCLLILYQQYQEPNLGRFRVGECLANADNSTNLLKVWNITDGQVKVAPTGETLSLSQCSIQFLLSTNAVYDGYSRGTNFPERIYLFSLFGEPETEWEGAFMAKVSVVSIVFFFLLFIMDQCIAKHCWQAEDIIIVVRPSASSLAEGGEAKEGQKGKDQEEGKIDKRVEELSSV